VGQAYGSLLREHATFPIYYIVFIIFVNYFVNSNRIWKASLVQVAYKIATAVAFHSV